MGTSFPTLPGDGMRRTHRSSRSCSALRTNRATMASALIAGPVYAHWHGRDKSGRPIVWIRPRLDLEDEEPQAKLMRMAGE